MKFVRNSLLLNELVLVDGIGRSGKVMLAEILTGFERMEKQDYNEFLEYIPLAYKYKKISKDMAIAILQTQLDTELYKNMIGRSINNRPTDYTSLSKYHTPDKYIKRQQEEDGPIIGAKVLKEKPIYLNWCHDLIQKSDIIFEAFQDKVKFIYINRRPVDIIYEWDKKNFGERIANDSTEMQYVIEHNNSFVPETAVGWEDEYLKMKPLERIVKLIHTSFKRNLDSIMINIEKIMIVNFEDLVTEPNKTIKDISSFLKVQPMQDILLDILAKENCPRILSHEDYMSRKKNITENLGVEYQDLLQDLESMYYKLYNILNKD